MTSSTGRRSARPFSQTGLTILEVVVAAGIISLLLIPSAMLYRRYRQGLLLISVVNRVVSACELARSCAINEGREYAVSLAGGSLAVLRGGTEPVGKRHRLPEEIVVASATRGFQPAVFLPDGTAKEAGNLVLRDAVTGRERKLVLHNLTGECTVE